MVVREGEHRGGEVGVRRRFEEKAGSVCEEADFYVCVCFFACVYWNEDIYGGTNLISCF